MCKTRSWSFPGVKNEEMIQLRFISVPLYILIDHFAEKNPLGVLNNVHYWQH